jgi:hypothetical protein
MKIDSLQFIFIWKNIINLLVLEEEFRSGWWYEIRMDQTYVAKKIYERNTKGRRKVGRA